MTRPQVSAAASDHGIDWKQARVFLHRLLSVRLNQAERNEDLDDLTQLALVKLHRVAGRCELTEPRAMMTRIAQTTFIDYLRARKVRDTVLTRLEDGHREPMAPPPPRPGVAADPAETIRFVLLEVFRTQRPGCHSLAQFYFRGLNWKDCAESLEVSHESVRQRWSRCVTWLKDLAADLPELAALRSWALD